MELIVFWIIMAVIAGMIASSRGRSFFLFFLYGMAVWPIAIVHALLLRKIDENGLGIRLPSSAPREISGVIFGTPYWRDSAGRFCAVVSGMECAFPSLEILQAALTGGSVQAPLQPEPPMLFKVINSEDGRFLVNNGRETLIFLTEHQAKAYINKNKR